MGMNENKGIFGMVGELIGDIVESVLMVALTGVIVGLLFAPAFGDYIHRRMEFNSSFAELRTVSRRMIPVHIALWIICALSWIGLIWANYWYRH